METTSRGRKEEEWQTQKTRSDGKPTEVHGQEKKSSRVEAATPTVVMTDVTRAPNGDLYKPCHRVSSDFFLTFLHLKDAR